MGIYSIKANDKDAKYLFEALYGAPKDDDYDFEYVEVKNTAFMHLVYCTVKEDKDVLDSYKRISTERVTAVGSWIFIDDASQPFKINNVNACIASPVVFFNAPCEESAFDQIFDYLVSEVEGVENLYFVINLDEDVISKHSIARTMVSLASKGFHIVDSRGSKILVCHEKSWEELLNESVQSESEE